MIPLMTLLPFGISGGLQILQKLHEAMRSWAAEAVHRLATERANTVRYLREHFGNLTQFSAQNRLATPRMPVLYLFSGADLLTARALSPVAPPAVVVRRLRRRRAWDAARAGRGGTNNRRWIICQSTRWSTSTS